MRDFLLLLSLCLFSFFSCKNKVNVPPTLKGKDLITYVNPFIGTGGHGHTYPGASLPFGMMQLSPDTRLDGWDGCSGYHYSDQYIYGFSHTHLSGTGVSDYGDILLMPTNEAIFNNGEDGKKGYRATFTHDKEVATPGYYQVHLEDTNIDVELTVAARSGIHRYQFPSPDHQWVVLDLEHRDETLAYQFQQIDNKTVNGFRHSKAWAEQQMLFFHMEFSHEIKTINNNVPTNPSKVALQFDNPNNEPILIKVGISPIDEKGAQQNLSQEIGEKTFDQIKTAAQDTWEKQLEKIVIESGNEDDKTNFYTAMYHLMLAPNIYQDVDGRYRGMDLKIHQAQDFDYYTVFSLWDTYRAANPLYTILEPDRTNDFINTFLAKYKEGGIMPIWDLSANYTGCMIGYHAVPVIADAYLKGIRDYDAELALTAMKHSATQDKLGLASFKSRGYIPVEEESESVSKTLEYAFDDWTIGQMAKAMGKPEDYKQYTRRAQQYKNIFDPTTQFMRGRFRNTWFSPFDPYEVNFNYTEANAWQYSNYVPQDISGYSKLLGGKENLAANLDTLFTTTTQTSGNEGKDITGLIGQYAHGNEPSHHMAYLYNFVNQPHKTQQLVHQILTNLYQNQPDGISGNEDCGQMSAWYIFSSLGFYPVTPASNQYIIGTPLFDKATIQLDNNNSFTVIAKGLSATHLYIQSAQLNGKPLNRTYLTHDEIINGGVLEFQMSDAPSDWGTKEGQEPQSAIEDHLIVPSPFIAQGDIAFKNSTEVALQVAGDDHDIFYSIDDSGFEKYENPFTITESSLVKVYAKNKEEVSPTISTQFFKIDPNVSVKLETEYANQYNAGGDHALIDGIKATKDFRTGLWQGYSDKDVIATVDLGKPQQVNQVSVNFLQDQRSWIFYPTSVHCWGSNDGINFTPFPNSIEINTTEKSEEIDILEAEFKIPNQSYRYVKVVAKKLGELPKWHLGYKHNGRSWIFVDEITIQ